jgi:hypothetical protein
MAIVPQHATAMADGSGDAVFVFPDVPQGELWCGTTQIRGAPATAVGIVTASGEFLGEMFGAGSWGPWTCGATRILAITTTGLNPGTQYQAVWHADSQGAEFSTYPSPITPTAVSGGGSVIVANFPAIQTVDGTVDVGALPKAAAVESGEVTMTGFVVNLPANAPVVGVVLSAPATNGNPVYVGGVAVAIGTGMILSPGQAPTPVLPVANSDALFAIGTGPDVLSFLVI